VYESGRLVKLSYVSAIYWFDVLLEYPESESADDNRLACSPDSGSRPPSGTRADPEVKQVLI
jgi:hypothetical protein